MWSVTLFFCCVWTVSLLYGELFSFWFSGTCSWPHQSSKMDGVDYRDAYARVAVIADPQLMDKTSHNFVTKSLLEMAQFYTDIFMRRAYLASISPKKPDVILFLGDYFDGGMSLSDDEWQESLSRLKHIFALNSLEKSMKALVYHLPGNHDIGYTAFHSNMPQAIRRYEKVFGSRNYQFTVGEVDFIAIDAQTVDGQPKGNLTSETWDFVESVARDSVLRPRVLLTHIPLYRPDWTNCGPLRFSSIINQRVSRSGRDWEITYQNYITEEATNKLLESVKPALILSGHDHDQCTLAHKTSYGAVTEHTVGTVSWQQGNIFPSYMLLSATTMNVSSYNDSTAAVLTQLCFLPVQLYIYLWYLFLFIMTLLAALTWPTSGLRFTRKVVDFLKNNIFVRGGIIKEKNEDENCEYEMVWDAEGSMHLIKKAIVSTTNTNKATPIERGNNNVVLRSTAKKPQEEKVDVSVDIGNDATSTRLAGANKAKIARKAFIKVLRVLRVLSVVAALNLPIYIMLLFKDWIDI